MEESEEYDEEIDKLPAAPRGDQARKLDNRVYFNK